jgi:uncharacterized protein YcaQ
VQIDTINVIERSHHHILWSRIPAYARADLHHALSQDKSIFEYWAHALAYIPIRDYRFFMPDMKRHRANPAGWFGDVTPADVRRVVVRVRREGALSIRDIDDDALVDKHHPWASRKPSKRALQHAFFGGILTISARDGMVKSHELADRHFGWPRRPRAATERQTLDYLLDRALRAQGVVSLDSICYMDAPRKKPMATLIEARVGRRKLVPVAIDGLKPHRAAPKLSPPPFPSPTTSSRPSIRLSSAQAPRRPLRLPPRLRGLPPRRQTPVRLLRPAGSRRRPRRRRHRPPDRPRRGQAPDPAMDVD